MRQAKLLRVVANILFTIFGYTLGYACNIFYSSSCTWSPSKLLPLQIFRLFCELWILKVDYVDHKSGVICEKLLSPNADFHSTIEQFVNVVVAYIFP
uniref:Uncharacterized protein n=1 Tax=Lepeophtheirus salmonis TaxID=72036 RepID=A0A0K2UHU2_LEPSM